MVERLDQGLRNYARAIERFNGVQVDAIAGAAVHHTQEDHIPLVALNVLQILDEQGLGRAVGPFFQSRIFGTGFAEQIVDQMLLGDVEGDDTETLLA